MNAEQPGLVAFLEIFGRCDVCGDHEFFDQAMAVQPGTRHDGRDLARAVDDDLALGDVQFQRPTLRPCLQQGREGAVERFQDRFD